MPEEIYILEGVSERDVSSIYEKHGDSVVYKIVLFHKKEIHFKNLPKYSVLVVPAHKSSEWTKDLFIRVRDLVQKYTKYSKASNLTIQYIYTAKFKLYFDLKDEYLHSQFINELEKDSAICYSPYKLNYPNSFRIRTNKSSNRLQAIISLISFACFIIIRLLASLLNSSNRRPILIYSSVFARNNCLDPETLDPIFINPYIEYLTYNNDEYQLAEDCGTSFKSFSSYFRNIRPKASFRNLIEVYLLKTILSPKKINSIIGDKNVIKSDLDNMLNKVSEEADRNILLKLQSYKGLEWLYLFRFYSALSYFNNNPQIKLIATVAENSTLFKPILDAAKMYKIRTIGIQHGTIHELHPHYMWHMEDIDHHPYPDITILWGNYWRDFLVQKGNVPKASLMVLGHLRTDVIFKLQNKSKSKRSSLNILFASQPILDPNYRNKTWDHVIECFKDLSDDYTLFIRPHPKEIDSSYLMRQLSRLRRQGIKYNLCHDESLYSLFTFIDILIVAFSTVAVEAQYFRIDVITLDYYDLDKVGLIKNKIAVNAKDGKTINSYLKRKNKGDKLINISVQENFIQKFSYKVDGNRIKEYRDTISELAYTANNTA